MFALLFFLCLYHRKHLRSKRTNVVSATNNVQPTCFFSGVWYDKHSLEHSPTVSNIVLVYDIIFWFEYTKSSRKFVYVVFVLLKSNICDCYRSVGYIFNLWWYWWYLKLYYCANGYWMVVVLLLALAKYCLGLVDCDDFAACCSLYTDKRIPICVLVRRSFYEWKMYLPIY